MARKHSSKAPAGPLHEGFYRLRNSNFHVRTASAELAFDVARICHQFASEPTTSAVTYEARQVGATWHILCDGKVVEKSDSMVGAVYALETHMVRAAVAADRTSVYWHGSALVRDGRTVLIPGDSGIGKTTLSLALSANGFKLLADDVAFFDPSTGSIELFRRAPHVHEDAIPRLQAVGFPYQPELRYHACFEVESVPAWASEPSPPLSHVLFAEWDETGTFEHMPVTQAEAAIELHGLSQNLRSFPEGGWPVLERALANVRSYRVLRSGDLRASVDAIRDLIDNVEVA